MHELSPDNHLHAIHRAATMLTIRPTDSDSETTFLSGWKSPESDFVWALGPVNIMNIPLGLASEYRGRNLRFSIEVNVPITDSNPEGSLLTFMLGSKVLLEQTVRERTRIVFHAPADVTAPRLNILHITNHNPATIDSLTLGFQLYSIEIDEQPTLREGDVFQFGIGSPYCSILSQGWKDPEDGFCWSTGKESLLTLFFDAELCRYDQKEFIRLAEVVFSVSFHSCIDPSRSPMHALDVVANQILIQRQIYPGLPGLVTIHAFVPLQEEANSELRLIDHGATTPAQLGNDTNDHTVLGFQLFSLELLRILTVHRQGLPAITDLFLHGSPLGLMASGGVGNA